MSAPAALVTTPTEFQHQRHIENLTDDTLGRLNSATKYPSISPYHALGNKGRLTEDRTVDFTGQSREIAVTEKIDGTNARIIIPPRGCGGALVGSRDSLIAYEFDRMRNPELGIVATLDGLFERMANALTAVDKWVVVFGEVYGGGVGKAARNYSTDNRTGFAVFDIAVIPDGVLDMEREQIAAWRKNGGQRFLATGELWAAAHALDGDPLPLVPAVPAPPPPPDVAGTHAWLGDIIGTTHAALDPTLDARAEGVVVRTIDRSRIAKIRFDDYERTARQST